MSLLLIYRNYRKKKKIDVKSNLDLYKFKTQSACQDLYKIFVSIFEEILIFSLTTCTKKNGSEATLGTLGKEKLKFTKKNLTAKNGRTKFSY